MEFFDPPRTHCILFAKCHPSFALLEGDSLCERRGLRRLCVLFVPTDFVPSRTNFILFAKCHLPLLRRWRDIRLAKNISGKAPFLNWRSLILVAKRCSYLLLGVTHGCKYAMYLFAKHHPPLHSWRSGACYIR